MRKRLQDAEERIEALVGEMTLEEKCGMCHASGAFTSGGVERLGIPELVCSDGPHGVRQELDNQTWMPVGGDEDRVGYLPTAVAVAATWNPAMASLFGRVLGAEARARGKDVILGPGVNIVRTPLCGRNFEYYSEDPRLTAAMAVACIRGIQEQDVAACVKHFALNNQELARFTVDVDVDERVVRELYLPAFKTAVEQGGVLTLMGAYNRFRGRYCCHNAYLLKEILKEEWGFEGAVISDWGGTHDTIEAGRDGLDIEMGGQHPSYDDFYLGRPLREAVAAGRVDVAAVDDKVRRILRTMAAVGTLGTERSAGHKNTPEHHRSAYRIAAESLVLLKNEGDLLPLDAGGINRIAVIGDNATARHGGGGGSSAVKALYEVTPLEGLRGRLGDSVEIVYVRGYPIGEHDFEPIAAEHLSIADENAGTNGWVGRYWNSRGYAGEPVGVIAEATVCHDFHDSVPVPGLDPERFSAEWTAELTPPCDGTYEIVLRGTDSAQLLIDDAMIHTIWGTSETCTLRKTVTLKRGRRYRLRVQLDARTRESAIHVGWVPPWVERKSGAERFGEAVEAARQADVVLFFGGLNHRFDTEGSDRTDLALPDGQDELIEALVEANPRTAVILTGGSAMAMPWVDRVPAVIVSWYGGMEGGTAVADTLMGVNNPSGRLPVTFPRGLEEVGAHVLEGAYDREVSRYREGMLVGYRWYDAKGGEPLFAFGHGLSYTRFDYGAVRVTENRGLPDPSLTLELAVTNGGDRGGAEVVQAYVRGPAVSAKPAVKALAAFGKVWLEAGRTRTVGLSLTKEVFSLYDDGGGGWTVRPGEYEILVGASSGDIRRSAKVRIA
jgi:beta-glucosidase